jgi:hypothetical protein
MEEPTLAACVYVINQAVKHFITSAGGKTAN